MTALAFSFATRPAFPLGKPATCDRYGMTPEQANVYRWLVKNRPHRNPFAISFREVAIVMASTHGNIHARVSALVERGWLERNGARYRLVAPIMHFKERR